MNQVQSKKDTIDTQVEEHKIQKEKKAELLKKQEGEKINVIRVPL